MVAILLILAIASATLFIALRPVPDETAAVRRASVLRVDLADRRDLDDP